MNEKKQVGNASMTLGILSLVLGWLIPLVGVVLGIVGLSIKKPEHKRNACITLNIIGLVVAVIFWLFWIGVYLSALTAFY
jgi:uncharacterized membrane protein